eukprot:2750017-Rhodomonas_salina.2
MPCRFWPWAVTHWHCTYAYLVKKNGRTCWDNLPLGLALVQPRRGARPGCTVGILCDWSFVPRAPACAGGHNACRQGTGGRFSGLGPYHTHVLDVELQAQTGRSIGRPSFL